MFRRLVCFLLAWACMATPIFAEIKLPPEVYAQAREGINGVYSLDFDVAEQNIQKVFAAYPDHPFAHFGNAMIAWSRYEYEFEKSDEKQQKVFEQILDDSISGIKRWLKKTRRTPTVIWGLARCTACGLCSICATATGLPPILPGAKPLPIWKNPWRWTPLIMMRISG